MASKYVTDDGLDLDSRYLGINAKAKSAETADSVNGEGVFNKLGLDGDLTVSLSQTAQRKDLELTIPTDMYVQLSIGGRGSTSVADGYRGTVTVKKDGVKIASGSYVHGDKPTNYSYSYNGFMKEGSKLSVSASGDHVSYVDRFITGTGNPVRLYAISEEDSE